MAHELKARGAKEACSLTSGAELGAGYRRGGELSRFSGGNCFSMKAAKMKFQRLSGVCAAILGMSQLLACGGAPAPATEAPSPLPPGPLVDTDEQAELVDRSRLPEPGPAPEWAPPGVSESRLSFGARLWHVKQGKTPLVSLAVVIPRGSATDPAGKEGLSQLTTDLLSEGAGALDALGLSEELQRLATDYGAHADLDGVELHMDLLSENFDASAKLLADMVLKPRLAQVDFERRKREVLTQALTDEKEPDFARSAVVRRALFGQGYASYSARGNRETLQRISLADIRRHHAQLFVPKGAIFVVAGGIDEASAKAGLEAAFAGWTDKPGLKPRAVEAEPKRGGVHLVDFPGATQSAIAIAVRAEPYQTEDYFAAQAYNWVLGGAFTSRLNMNLREEKGYTYGARSHFSRWKHTGFYWLAAKVKSETTRASVDEMLKEVSDICGARPLTELEHQGAIRGMLLGYPGQFETVSGTANELIEAAFQERPSNWFGTWISGIEQVSLSQAQAFGAKYCNPADYVVVIAGDRASVTPTLASLERPVQIYNALGKVQP